MQSAAGGDEGETSGLTFAVRWRWRVGFVAAAAVVAFVVYVAVAALLSSDHPVLEGLVFVAWFGLLYGLIPGPWSLVADASGLIVRYERWRWIWLWPAYRIVVPWDAIEAIRPGRRGLVIPIIELITSEVMRLENPDGGPVDGRLEDRLRRRGLDRRTDLRPFVEDWRTGPFGEAVRRHRPDLLAD